MNNYIFEHEMPVNFYGDDGFISDMISEMPIIRMFDNKICFEGIGRFDLICYFFFSLWFAYAIMLPTLLVLYLCVVFEMTNKYVGHFLVIFIVMGINLFLLMQLKIALFTFVCFMWNQLFLQPHEYFY
jgi:hypothetical protein